MSTMEMGVWAIVVLLVALIYVVTKSRDAIAGPLAAAVVFAERNSKSLDALAKLLEQQNYRLEGIASAIVQRPRGYVPPTVRFCDRCRKEFPESNRWWTAYQLGIAPFKFCAYPQQKEKPEDKWLHGEECIMAEMRAYMTNVLRQLQRTSHKQKREYTEYDSELETSHTRSLNISHCGHCEKEYSESQFWWTVSARGMQIEVADGFRYSRYHARDYYFCSEDCVLAAVEIFIAAQPVNELTDEMIQEYEEYWADAGRSNSRAWLAAYSAAQASPPTQTVPATATTQEMSAKEPARRSIPWAIGRALWRLLHRTDA